jgi:hypothetical protein
MHDILTQSLVNMHESADNNVTNSQQPTSDESLEEEYPIELPLSPLCTYCESAFSRFRWDEMHMDYLHTSASSIQSSAESGCGVCQEIVRMDIYKEGRQRAKRENRAYMDEETTHLVFSKISHYKMILNWVGAYGRGPFVEIIPATGSSML